MKKFSRTELKQIFGGSIGEPGSECTFRCTNGETFTCTLALECAQKASEANCVMPNCECTNVGCS